VGLRRRTLLLATAVALVAGATSAAAGARTPRPDALVDLRTAAGAALVRGTWRWHEARIVEIDSQGPGPDLRASGAALRTHDLTPAAGAAGFDDAGWEAIAPESLEARRGTGRLSFGWYRIRVTIPERVAAFDPTGATVVFEIVVDDYAEVWVDGRLPVVLGQRGGALVAGFNAPNRVVVARDARPGQQIQLAVLGANGPLSAPPANFIWVRSATLEFHAPTRPEEAGGTVERRAAGLDGLVPPGTRIEKLADGFTFTEGPVWIPDGYLLFSDPNDNVIYRFAADDGVSVFRTKSGYTGADIGRYGQPGSNGLALDREGRLTICEHGNRRVTRLERNGTLTVLADRYKGKRLNSPNDLVYRSDGALYFSDPPFGLPGQHDDPARELPYSGVFRLAEGKLTLVAQDLSGPNGVAFSPDERHLYVTNWDLAKKVVTRYPVRDDGTLEAGTIFFDMGGAPGAEALDGLEVDRDGNLYVSGPGGAWVISPAGEHLGTIRPPELPANFAWGDDGRSLYMTARTGLYRIRLGVPGARP
jgi:gluconolactonase